MYEDYSESKYGFAVKKSSKVTYKILLLSDSTFFKLFIHIFAAIIEALIIAGHKFLYTLPIEGGRPVGIVRSRTKTTEFSLVYV